MSDNLQLFGVLYLHGGGGANTWTTTAGTTLIEGAVVGEGNLSVVGAPTIVFNPAVLRTINLKQGSLVRIPGSWRDFAGRELNMRTNHRFSRGVSMVEAMVALAVMAFGMLTVVGVQSTLRLNADVAKQRSEATRLAQEKLDEWRTFTVIDTVPPAGQTAWNAIANDVSTVNGSNATYEVRREVVATADPPTKVVRVTVSWSDRAAADANDKNQRVMLSSSIAAAAPALSGTLAVRPGIASVAPVRRPFKRHPTIPVLARDLGNGQSAFVPPFRPWVVIVFNNVTGVVTGVCDLNYDTSNDTITNNEVEQCSNTTEGQLLSGFVRFQRQDGPGDLTAADVEDPPGPALNLRMLISLTSLDHSLAPFCIDDANSVQRRRLAACPMPRTSA